MGPGVHVQGKQVDSGGFLVYPPTEAHHNPDLFPEPFEYGLSILYLYQSLFLIVSSVGLILDDMPEEMVRYRHRVSSDGAQVSRCAGYDALFYVLLCPLTQEDTHA